MPPAAFLTTWQLRSRALHALLCILVLTALGLPAAQADVWGYVDEQGNTHFSTRQIDERYQLYFRTETGTAPLLPDEPSATDPQTGTTSRLTPRLAFNPSADAAAGVKA